VPQFFEASLVVGWNTVCSDYVLCSLDLGILSVPHYFAKERIDSSFAPNCTIATAHSIVLIKNSIEQQSPAIEKASRNCGGIRLNMIGPFYLCFLSSLIDVST
jgi:hypothetical protein